MERISAPVFLLQVLLILVVLMGSFLVQNTEHMSGTWLFAFSMILMSVVGFVGLQYKQEC
ncbi:hypothetical protein [Exiguobacterium sp. BG5(2022)]|uniref:hypothetical protein n=1 Tax=Exiguobacterium sp. BG5(2022) TaxID=2962595 RepID=UPI002881DAFF|nr:hypothetical protein [Exiguobacterium sp. BG5(2022)]MDT0193714.1 hypothetical protein [Exiguobacterium sp. BG5(2022)]